RLKWKRSSVSVGRMLRAVIFDFNGILVDDEPIHLDMFRKVLNEDGISLDEKEYYARYLGMDDRSCFRTVYERHGRKLDEASLADKIRRKAIYYRQAIEGGIAVFPAVLELIPQLAARLPLAIASGALRSEIELILQSMNLRSCFQVIVSAEDVEEGKPNPEIFLKALGLLNQGKSGALLQASECLVVEDSKEGISAAHRAGIKCLAVTNSHPAEELTEAEAVVNGLDQVTIPFLEKLVA
ncbi:MAG: HAD family hydrolase, partial [Candidatus Binatia bacterium]